MLVLALVGCQPEPPAPSKLALSSFAPGGAEALIEEALGLMDRYGSYASGVDWNAARARALDRSKDASDAADARRIVDIALLVAGGTHSKLSAPADAPTSRVSLPLPIVDPFDGGVASLTLPAFSGTDESQIDEYVTSTWNAIRTLSS